ncbi:Hypothetical predicted protein [Cloeon dipterum]|uniref:protein-tyrosine-phosphatase n=1 Tax=Cloeon dipterum TaxID=197152 RepID=A0A8S1BUC5_9INSE|nr:Hypothetical predicted protein [Cloeon dipterum]
MTTDTTSGSSRNQIEKSSTLTRLFNVSALLEMESFLTVLVLIIFARAAALDLFLVKNVQNNTYDCVSFEDANIDNVFEATYMTHTRTGTSYQEISEIKESGYTENNKRLVTTMVNFTNNESILSQFGFIFDHGWEGFPTFRSGVIDMLTTIPTYLRISLWAKGPCYLKIGNFVQLKFAPTESGLHAKVSVSFTKIEKEVDFLANRWNHFSLKYDKDAKRLVISDSNNKSISLPISVLRWPANSEKFDFSFDSDDGEARIKLHKYKALYFNGSSIGGGINILRSKVTYCLAISHVTNSKTTFKIKSGNNQAYFPEALQWRNRFFFVKREGVRLEGKLATASSFLAMRLLDANCVYRNGHKQIYTRKFTQVPNNSKVSCMTVTNSKTVTESAEVSTLYWEDSSRLELLCKNQNNQCRGYIFCGEKGCTCIPPFTGPLCLDSCNRLSSYGCGAPCGFCRSASDCDEKTGKCKVCIKGYRKLQCTQKLLQFRLKPEIVEGERSISLQKALENLTSEETAQIKTVEIQYKTLNESDFSTFYKFEPNSPFNETYALPRVHIGTAYQFRAAIREKDEESIFVDNTNDLVLDFVFSEINDTKSKDHHEDDSPLELFVSILSACLAVAILLILAGCLCRMRRMRHSSTVVYNSQVPDSQSVSIVDNNDGMEEETKVKSLIYSEIPQAQEHIYEELHPLYAETNLGMDVRAYQIFVETSLREQTFKKQFKAIKEAAGIREMDYLAPLSGEIILEKDKEFRTRSFYYDGFMCSRRYIATECPKRKDASNFWKLVVQENVQSVVLLADAEIYWPLEVGKEIKFDSVALTAIERYSFCHFEIATIKISTGGERRTVRHLHFKTWFQNDLPQEHLTLAQFIEKVNPDCHKHGPILIQCASKISRIGIFIYVHMCKEMINKKGVVYPEQILSFMFKQSIHFMDSHRQYMFANLVLFECLAANKGMLCANFEHFYKRLLKDKSVLIQSYNELKEQISKDAECRHCLGVPSKERSLNMFIVDGFSTENQFIIIPKPKPIYFWGLVTEQKMQQVVILNESITKTNGFLPQKNSPLIYGNLNLSLEGVHVTKIFKSLQVGINNTAGLKDHAPPRKIVNVMVFRGWRENSLPSPLDLVSFWNESEICRGGPQTTLLVCDNGSSSCGLYLAVGHTIEKIKLEQLVDVNWPIRKLRQQSESMVQGIVSFSLCWLNNP